MHGALFCMHASNTFGEFIFDEYYIKWNTERQGAAGSMLSVHIPVDFYVQSFFFPILLWWRARTFSVPRNWIYCNRVVVAMAQEIGWHWCARTMLLMADDVFALLLYSRMKCSTNSRHQINFFRCLFILLICLVFLSTYFRIDFWVCLQWKCCIFFSTLLLTQPK